MDGGRLLRLKAGWGGHPLIGTPEKIVDTIQTLSNIGLDGISLIWVDYTDGIARWEKDIMPLLEQSGLRKSFASANLAARPSPLEALVESISG